MRATKENYFNKKVQRVKMEEETKKKKKRRGKGKKKKLGGEKKFKK